ncbi:MAG: 5-formyltetrahydrofolate cyclo-ligase [Christensenellales bacterium]|jgi:5-formyltetrahydrofolate cyclo-ligase
MDIQSTKLALRKQMRSKRQEMEPHRVDELSAEIQTKTTILKDFNVANTVFIYLHNGNEPKTDAIISLALSQEKEIYVPILLDNQQMKAQRYTANTPLTKNVHGILEPAYDESQCIAATDIDLVILPGLAFDACGRRLGQGMGYYDTFLTDADAYCVALAYEWQIQDRVPTDAHDMTMDVIVTEENIYFSTIYKERH